MFGNPTTTALESMGSLIIFAVATLFILYLVLNSKIYERISESLRLKYRNSSFKTQKRLDAITLIVMSILGVIAIILSI